LAWAQEGDDRIAREGAFQSEAISRTQDHCVKSCNVIADFQIQTLGNGNRLGSRQFARVCFFSVSAVRARGVSRGALKIKKRPFFCHTSVIRSPLDQLEPLKPDTFASPKKTSSGPFAPNI
jgi:hypothetical protein